MTALCPPRPITRPARASLNARAKRHDLIENIEWLLQFNVGETAILASTGKKADTLKTALSRAGRPDLIPRIFEHDQRINERLGR